MIKRKYWVRAEHVAPIWREIFAELTPIEVATITGDLWYASHPELGCGKEYGSPVAAITHLLRDHGYTSISVEGEANAEALRAWNAKPADSIDADTLRAVNELVGVERALRELEERRRELHAEIMGAVIGHCESEGITTD